MHLYELHIPDQVISPVIASIPHSGTYIPDAIRRQFKTPCPVLANSDWHLDKLYDFLPELGVTVLQATHSRYVVDLNRRLKAPLSGSYKNAVVYEETTFGTPLYDIPPTPEEIDHRITIYYQPYHERLTRLLEETIRRFGKVYMLDLHSFFIQSTKDICLGNQHNRTSSSALLDCYANAFRANDFEVARNKVLLGGYITQHYGAMENVQSLQIEIRYPAYLDKAHGEEEVIEEWDSAHFRDAQARLRRAFSAAISQA